MFLVFSFFVKSSSLEFFPWFPLPNYSNHYYILLPLTTHIHLQPSLLKLVLVPITHSLLCQLMFSYPVREIVSLLETLFHFATSFLILLCHFLQPQWIRSHIIIGFSPPDCSFSVFPVPHSEGRAPQSSSTPLFLILHPPGKRLPVLGLQGPSQCCWSPNLRPAQLFLLGTGPLWGTTDWMAHLLFSTPQGQIWAPCLFQTCCYYCFLSKRISPISSQSHELEI